MPNGLNFNRLLIALFLPFVSLLIAFPAYSQTSGQATDEFDLFEEEIKKPLKPNSEADVPVSRPSVGAPPSKSSSVKETSTIELPEVVDLNASETTTKESSDKKVDRLKTEIRGGPQNMALIVKLAEELYGRAEFDKVTALLWKHVDKIDRKGLLLLTRAHEKRKEPAEMIRSLNILIGKNDKDYEAYELMGNAHMLQRKAADAVEAYKKAIEINPKVESAYDGLIRLYEHREPPNFYELRMIYQDMIESIGRRAQYVRKLCEINTRDGIYESAISTCKEAIQMDSKVADPYVYLGLSQKASADEKNAAVTLKKAAIEFPKSELAQYQYGHLLEEQKSYVDAMKVFKMGTEADDKAARSWLGLATTSFEIRKYEIALLAYRNACKYDKKTAVAFRRATTVLRNQRNTEWIGKFESSSENCNL